VKQRLSDKIIVIAGTFVVLAMFFCGCSRPPVSQEIEQKAREQSAVLTTDCVVSLISDSGVTRYRIETPQWSIYDRTEPPYQEFPKGIYLEQFDEDLHVRASLKADYAYYNETAQIWILAGNVHAMNRKGEQFDTPLLNWDQNTHRVYSDTTIHITREKSIIEGIGFDSNEEMNDYTILKPTGVFPIDED